MNVDISKKLTDVSQRKARRRAHALSMPTIEFFESHVSAIVTSPSHYNTKRFGMEAFEAHTRSFSAKTW
jgi:hypothetical protein